MKTELTVEQSAKLIELGVDASLASKCRVQDEADLFDLSDILSILPKEIKGYQLHIDATIKGYSAAYYVIYDDEIMDIDEIDNGDGSFSAPELTDSLYKLLIWTIENNYLTLNTEKK